MDKRRRALLSPRSCRGFTVDNAGSLGEQCYGCSARPKIVKYTLPDDATGFTLIHGCDGVWDVADSEDVGDLISHKWLQKYPNQAQGAAAAVVVSAYHACSMDNISVVVSQL